MEHQKHLVIACGGTGGHFYPTLAVARSFVAKGGRVTLLVSGRHAAEQAAIAADYHFDAVEHKTIRLPGSPLAALAFPFRFLKCYLEARKLLKTLQPDCLLGMGSFAAAPACLAVNTGRCPLFLHEGNAFMGRTNRIFARKASRIALSLPLADNRQLHGTEGVITGMPLRADILRAAAETPSAEEYLQTNGLDSSLKTILVFGGSQGARQLNEIFMQGLCSFDGAARHFQVIQLTGSEDNSALKDAYSQAGIRSLVLKGESHIEKCYLAADLVICRAGASSICELALFGKPVILIPFPFAADDHQTKNARLLEQHGAARCCPQKELSITGIQNFLKGFLTNPQDWKDMGHRMKEFACPDAAEKMAELLWK